MPSTAAGVPIASGTKSGINYSLVLDSSAQGTSVYVYCASSTVTGGYVARIDPDGSYTPLNGGTVGGGGGGGGGGSDVTLTGTTTVDGPMVFTPSTLTSVPLSIQPSGATLVDAFQVIIGGNKEVWINDAGKLFAQAGISTSSFAASGATTLSGPVSITGTFTASQDLFTISNTNGGAFSVAGGTAGAGLSWNAAGHSEASIYTSSAGALTASFWNWNGTSYVMSSSIASNGTYTAGTSTYGPTATYINGPLTAQNGFFSGAIAASAASLTGALSASAGTFVGLVSASGGAFTGAVAASAFSGSGALLTPGTVNIGTGGAQIGVLPVVNGGSGVSTLAAAPYVVLSPTAQQTGTINVSGSITSGGDLTANNGFFSQSVVSSFTIGLAMTGTSSNYITSSTAASGTAFIFNATGGTVGNLASFCEAGATRASIGNGGLGTFVGVNVGGALTGGTTAAFSSTLTLPQMVLVPTGVGGLSGASVFIQNDAATVNGLDFNVPTSSTNGFRFSVNGTTKAQINASGSFIAASSTYGPTSASIDGVLTLQNVGSGSLPNAASISGGGSGALLLNAESGQPVYFLSGSTGATSYGTISASGYSIGSSTYGPTSAAIAGNITGTSALGIRGGTSNPATYYSGQGIGIGSWGTATTWGFMLGNATAGTYPWTNICSNGETVSGIAGSVLQVGNYNTGELMAIDANGDLGILGWLQISGNAGFYNDTWNGGFYFPSTATATTYGSSNIRITGNYLAGGGSANQYGALTIQGEKSGWSGLTFQNDSGAYMGTLMAGYTGYGADYDFGYMGFYNEYTSVWMFQADYAGNGIFAGTCTATSFADSSDRTLKTNIKPLTSSLDIVKALEPVSFNFIASGLPSLGFIAQDVRELLPALVTNTDTCDTLFLNYSGIIPVVTKAFQEKCASDDEIVAGLRADIASLRIMLDDSKTRIKLLEGKQL